MTCNVPECGRECEPGWAVCATHVDYFEVRFGTDAADEPLKIAPDDHLDDWSPGELMEAFGR